MRKLSFTSQLVILFSFILLITTIFFSFITITSVRSIAYDEVYSRLTSYYTFINTMDRQDDRPKPERDKYDMRFGYIKYDGSNITEYELYFEYDLQQASLNKLVDRIKEEMGSQGKKCKGTWKWRGEKCKNSKIYKDIVTFSKCLAQKNYIQYKLIHTDD